MTTLPTPNGEHLNLLLTLLEEIRLDGGNPKRPAFSLSNWVAERDVQPGGTAVERLRASSGRSLPEGFCGTAACAVGSACLDPRFVALRLTVDVESSTGNGVPVYGTERGWGAVCAFFGITDWESKQLFAAGSYRLGDGTPVNQVLSRLREFIRSKGLLPD